MMDNELKDKLIQILLTLVVSVICTWAFFNPPTFREYVKEFIILYVISIWFDKISIWYKKFLNGKDI